MIEILRDQLPQLLPGVLAKRFRWLQALAEGPLAHERNLVPEHKTVAVSEVMNRLTMLVMGEAYAGDAHLTHRRLICGDVLQLRAPPFPFTVLMVADAVHGYMFSVEKEATVRIEPNLPNAKGQRYTIHDLGGFV
jgi:hypothetical protein